jgi:iron complex transport system ATP-binding protein
MIPLHIDGVSISYEKRIAVHELGLDVGAGEWLSLIGPNGAGKTTLLRAIAGLLPHTGSITMDGAAVSAMPAKKLARTVAFVHQEPLMPAGMSVAHYVMLGRTPHIAYFSNEGISDRRVVASVLARLSLTSLAGRMLDQLSGGERQRVAIARALAQQAPVLLLDEPTRSLDIGAQQEVLELVDMMRTGDGLTVISAMHDLTLAGQYADRLALLSGGRLAALGPPGDVLTEETIGQHFKARIRIVRPSGSWPAVVPARSGNNSKNGERL